MRFKILNTKYYLLIFFILAVSVDSFSKESRERILNYKLKKDFLKKGGFQYFYALLKKEKPTKNSSFINIQDSNCKTPADEIIKTFLPLDLNKKWNPKEDNYLAVIKLNYILPTSIKNITKERITSVEYIQKTIPRYKVTAYPDYYHVASSFFTPEFRVYLRFLKDNDLDIKSLPIISINKVKNGTMKVTHQYQDNFGRVMFFKTAKAANTISIYEKLNEKETLVSQFILSNIINVPSKLLVKREMIKNISQLVNSSRSIFLNFN